MHFSACFPQIIGSYCTNDSASWRMCEVNRLQYPDMFSEVRCYVLDFLNLPDSELLMAQLFRKPLYVEKNPPLFA